MDTVECKFSIKRLQKSSDNDYIKSLAIYNDTTPYEIRTPTNEITYWINNQKKNTPFELYAFSLYINEINIGFLMLTYIKSTKIMIYEYLAVNESYRIHTVFLAFENLFRNYFKENNIEISYYLTEMSDKNDGKDIDRESKMFEKMLCIEDYGKIDMVYYALPLGLNNHESDFRAYLYARDVNNSSNMGTNTFLDIVHSIYFDYWMHWYEKIMTSEDIEIYRKQVQSYYNKIVDNAHKKNTISIQHSNCSILDKNADISHNELPIIKKTHKVLLWIFLSLFAMGFPAVVIFVYNKILTTIGLSFGNEGALLVAVFSSVTSAIVAVVSAKKSS